MKGAFRSLLVLIAASSAVAAWAATSAQAVEFEGRDGTRLGGWLMLPSGPAAHAPRGTVVALHGCGGLYVRTGRRQGQLNARHQAMGELLVEQGYAVLFPDSFTPRGVQEVCTQPLGYRPLNQVQRRHDALAALAWVAAQPWADAGKIAVLGWSHGGSAVLSATDATHPEVAAEPLRFATAIAFYPGCGAALKSGYRPNTRLAMMLGADDDWTPPGPCIELGKAVGAQLEVYPGAVHDFDNPVGRPMLRTDVPNGVRPGQGVHVAPHPAARAHSYARVLELLRQAFAHG